MISYSFHLSTGKHSLTTCRKVSGASKHNLRKYESEEYDRTQIAILRGGDTNILDDVYTISDEQALMASLQFAKDYGILIGISSGANIACALEIAKEVKNKKIVTIAPDGLEKYLSTVQNYEISTI